MLRNGLYKATYAGNLGSGYGLVHLADGKIHGGDAMIYYTGRYTSHENGTIDGKLKGKPYVDGGSSGMVSLFAREDNTIEITGDSHGDGRVTLEARSKQMPGIALKIELDFLAD